MPNRGGKRGVHDPRVAASWVGELRRPPGFQQLSDCELARIAKFLSPVSFSGGEVVVRAGTRMRSAFFIQHGEVGLFCKGEADGIPLDKLGPGHLLGAVALMGVSPISPATFVALSDVVALRLSRSGFVRLCERLPDIGYRVMTVLARRILDRRLGFYHCLRR